MRVGVMAAALLVLLCAGCGGSEDTSADAP